jgi:arginase family enzyme
MTFASFGCSLDVLDAADKVAMKLAYLNALRGGLVDETVARDPYQLLTDALQDEPDLVGIGRLEIETWLTPRPRLDALDRVDVLLYRDFLDSGGCSVVSARLREFVRDRVMPLKPFLIGVDHSLTAGVLEALAGEGPGGLGLIVLDSHFDAIPASVRQAAAGGPPEAVGDEEEGQATGEAAGGMTCGDWVAEVIERGVTDPQDVVVLGVSDHPGPDLTAGEDPAVAEYRRAYLELEERGVRVITKQKIREGGVARAAAEAVDQLRTSRAYVSIDADIAAGEEVKAVRFLDTIGLGPGDVVRLCGELAGRIADSGKDLAGFDVMEIDVHLADMPGSPDRTVEMCASAAHRILAAQADGGGA